MGYKIRQAQVQQIPYMLIVGSKEAAENTVSVRERREGDLGSKTLGEFRDMITKEISEKS